ncbi:MAG: septal ring lytic transglycosylase RlpA family protein [Hyphomicrobiaceae bacterium]|nr:MAG: septal ring lytic transglycosylase RlpA family protein [Hyphomicrobiaceae bacterium]
MKDFSSTQAVLGRGLVAALAGLILASCSRTPSDSGTTPRRQITTTYSPRLALPGEVIQKGGGVYKVGIPYQLNGQWYVPREEPGYDRRGIASWYGADFHGRRTANGEVYDMDALTAAHPTLPMPSYAYVTSVQNGRTILVRINDRGPYAHHRIIDLSRRSAFLLGIAERGTSEVRVRYAGPAPLDGSDRREKSFLASQSWYRQAVAQMRTPRATPQRSVVMRASNAVAPLVPTPKATWTAIRAPALGAHIALE